MVLWTCCRNPVYWKNGQPWFPLNVHPILVKIPRFLWWKIYRSSKQNQTIEPNNHQLIWGSSHSQVLLMLQPGLSKNRVALDGQITIFLLFIGDFWIYTPFPDTPKYHIGGLIYSIISKNHIIPMISPWWEFYPPKNNGPGRSRPEITVLPWRYLWWSQRPPALVDARLWPHRGLEQDQSHLESNKCGMYYTQCQLISKIYGGFGFNSIWNSTSDYSTRFQL